jgi:nitronate monooxygenase
MVSEKPGRGLCELLIVANFVEVHLAKEGHDGLVGINFLHKIQTPTLPSLYGAMLAGVDVVLMGAGIPLEIAPILDELALGRAVELQLHVGDQTHPHLMQFDPRLVCPQIEPPAKRPMFLPIVSSTTLATMLVKKSKGRIDGLVIEGPLAGGHNAPPRGAMQLSEQGEPVYGRRDEVDPAQIAALGLPFWLAGAQGTPEKLAEALELGATGIQVGSLFAFSEESGLLPEFKREVVNGALSGKVEVFRDPLASPTGYPFQVLASPGTLSDEAVYGARKRQCDLGYLREAVEGEDGKIIWRCPAEDVAQYERKGGEEHGDRGRKCLCNSLMANIGLGQVRSNGSEPALLTCGSDLGALPRLLVDEPRSYAAAEVIDFLLVGAKQLSAGSA